MGSVVVRDTTVAPTRTGPVKSFLFDGSPSTLPCHYTLGQETRLRLLSAPSFRGSPCGKRTTEDRRETVTSRGSFDRIRTHYSVQIKCTEDRSLVTGPKVCSYSRVCRSTVTGP